MWTVVANNSSTSDQGDASLTDDPGSAFSTVWNAVVSELNGESIAGEVATTATTLTAPLTPQQKAWLNLVQPLTIVEGFALLSVPRVFVQNEIDRHLRTPITDALSRRLGQQIQLGVRIAPPPADDENSFAQTDSPEPADDPDPDSADDDNGDTVVGPGQ